MIGFAHNVEIPTFNVSSTSATVSYSQQEEEALENQFSKQDFDQSLEAVLLLLTYNSRKATLAQVQIR